MAKGKSTIKLTDKDLGWGQIRDQVIKLSRSGGSFCTVGVQGAEAAANQQDTTLSVAQIANIHEYGKVIRFKSGRSIVIPQRSFIRAAIDEHFTAIQKRATLLGAGVMLLKFSAAEALALLGQYAVGVIKQRIANGIAPPNAPSTKKRKGSSTPLIDSGQLRGSITYKIEAS